MFLLDKSFWEIRKTKSTGKGVFATKVIPGGALIGDYTGRVISADEDTSDEYGMYNMWLHYNLVYADPETDGIHLLNHSCEPNCAMFPYQGHIIFFALRKIFPKEQLTIQYLIDPAPHKEVATMHPCFCKAQMCKGILHGTEEASRRWGDFLDIEYAKFKQEELPIGTVISKLAKYPEDIADNPVYDLFGSVKRSPLRLKNKTLPPLLTIRELIRDSGKRLLFPGLNLIIHGIQNEMVVAEVK
jgi:hypothetical protein